MGASAGRISGAFDLGRRRGLKPIEIVATFGALAVIAATVPLALGAQRIAAVAKARAWAVDGPPCPAMSRAAFQASGLRIAHVVDYDDVRFGRGYGYVTCVAVARNGGRGLDTVPVCQFNSPTVLEVTTPRADVYFATHIGPATVTIVNDRPRCVLNASIGLIALR
ncbi:MAG: hypothetical protein P4L73_02210 [Caulobacteraceae bacterium]|nr:hypothetical protein [Caulobacteraceae bacterium]